MRTLSRSSSSSSPLLREQNKKVYFSVWDDEECKTIELPKECIKVRKYSNSAPLRRQPGRIRALAVR